MSAVLPAISRRSTPFPKVTDAIVVHLIMHTPPAHHMFTWNLLY
jgi:hypothetical protein